MDKIKQLLGNRVMVEPSIMDNKTKSGIIISADFAKEKQGVGTILMLGPGVDNEVAGHEFKVGEEVLYGKMAGFDMEFQGKNVKILRDTDLSAILEETKNKK